MKPGKLIIGDTIEPGSTVYECVGYTDGGNGYPIIRKYDTSAFDEWRKANPVKKRKVEIRKPSKSKPGKAKR